MTADNISARRKGRIGHSKSKNGCLTCKYVHFSIVVVPYTSCSHASGFGESSAVRRDLSAIAARVPVADATTKL